MNNNIIVTLDFCKDFGYEKLKFVTNHKGLNIGFFRNTLRQKFKKLESEEERQAMIKKFECISPDYLMDRVETLNRKNIEATLDFCKIFGYEKLILHTNHKGLNIGSFRGHQRQKFKKLESEEERQAMIKKFECISPEYLLADDETSKRKNIEATLDFCKIFGYEKLILHTNHKGLNIGSFRGHQRQKFKKLESEEERQAMIKEFECISPNYLLFDRDKDSKRKNIEATLNFCKIFGYEKLNQRTSYNGFKIGIFRDYQRQKFRSLENKESQQIMIKEFECISLDYFFNSEKEIKKKNIEATLEFCKKFGFKNLKITTRYNNFDIGVFRNAQRTRFKRLKTEKKKQAMIKEFECISPEYLFFDQEDALELKYINALIEFDEKYGANRIKDSTIYNGLRIGLFIKKKNDECKQLKTENEKIEMINTFQSISMYFNYERIFSNSSNSLNKWIELTLDFCKKFGYDELKQTTKHNGSNIGTFRNNQRRKFKSLKTEEERQAMIKEFECISPEYLK